MSEGIEEDMETTGPNRSLDAQTADAASGDGDRNTTEHIDEMQALREQLADAQRQASESQDKYLRARADMENYKKRVERTYADRAANSKKDLLHKLLGVKDNMERALRYGEAAEGSGEGLMEGVRLTQYQLDQLLSQEGVTPIEALGKPFDPVHQEAVQSVNDPNVPDHTVIQEVRKGYIFNGDGREEVLRPAQVIVSVHQSDT